MMVISLLVKRLFYFLTRNQTRLIVFPSLSLDLGFAFLVSHWSIYWPITFFVWIFRIVEQNIALFSASPQAVIQLITANFSMETHLNGAFNFIEILVGVSLVGALNNFDWLRWS